MRNVKYLVAFLFFSVGSLSFPFLDAPGSIVMLVFAMLGILPLFNIPSKWIEDSFATISYRFKISSAIAGGVFLAIASSSPEFFTASSGVIWYKIFSIGFDTMIWSAIFNLCVIVGVGTFYNPSIQVDKSILKRDMPFLGMTIITLLVLAIDGAYSTSDFLLLIGLYIVYIYVLNNDNSKPYKNGKTNFSWPILIFKLIAGLVIIAFLAHSMVSAGQETIKLVEPYYSLPLGLLACTIYGPGTSFADLFMSIAAIKKGEDTAAIVNGISSNTFDLTICIGIPGLAYTFITGNEIIIDLKNSMLLIGMLLASFILLFFMLRGRVVTKKKGLVLLGFYAICMVVYLADILV